MDFLENTSGTTSPASSLSSSPTSSLPHITNIITNSVLDNKELNIDIQDELGRGNNGVVYKATSAHFNGDLVVKSTKLKPKTANKKDINFYCTSIINSIDIQSNFPTCSNLIICTYGIIANSKNLNLILEPTKQQLINKNLVFISNELDDNQIYLLYEYIHGKTLRQLIETDNTIDFVKYGRQILQTLILLQSNDLVHLDIKPENFMIDDDDNVKFIDTEFLCKQSHVNCTAKGMSASYTSPEAYDSMIYASFSPKKLAEKYPDKSYLSKSDVFSTGLVFYEMITKRKAMLSITVFGKKLEGDELDLEFPENMFKWKSLIQNMVLRDYKTRISAQEALSEFEKIRDKTGGNLNRKLKSLKKNKRKNKKYKTNKRKTNMHKSNRRNTNRYKY